MLALHAIFLNFAKYLYFHNNSINISWDRKGNSLWAVFISVLEMAILEALQVILHFEFQIFNMSKKYWPLTHELFHIDDTIPDKYRMDMLFSLQLSSFREDVFFCSHERSSLINSLTCFVNLEYVSFIVNSSFSHIGLFLDTKSSCTSYFCWLDVHL